MRRAGRQVLIEILCLYSTAMYIFRKRLSQIVIGAIISRIGAAYFLYTPRRTVLLTLLLYSWCRVCSTHAAVVETRHDDATCLLRRVAIKIRRGSVRFIEVRRPLLTPDERRWP